MDDIYKFTSIKYVNKLIHNNSDHFMKHYLLENRSNKNRIVSKLGPHKPEIGRNNHTQNTLLYTAVSNYNMLPDNLTKFTNPKLFKCWLKKYMMNPNINIPNNRYNPENMVLDPKYLYINLENLCEVQPPKTPPTKPTVFSQQSTTYDAIQSRPDDREMPVCDNPSVMVPVTIGE